MGSIKSKCGKNAAAVEDVKEEPSGIETDTAFEATEVGGARNMGVNTNGELKKVMAEGRKEIKDTQEKLNSSLTTPVLSDHNGAEARVRNQNRKSRKNSGAIRYARFYVKKKPILTNILALEVGYCTILQHVLALPYKLRCMPKVLNS